MAHFRATLAIFLSLQFTKLTPALEFLYNLRLYIFLISCSFYHVMTIFILNNPLGTNAYLSKYLYHFCFGQYLPRIYSIELLIRILI